MNGANMTRREFAARVAAGITTGVTADTFAQEAQPFRLRYILASCMYGTTALDSILAEVPKTGARHIEIWARRHGNQREQIDELGVDTVQELLRKHDVRLGSFTCFKFGIFRMQPEMALVKQLGGDMVICNSGGPRGQTMQADDLKSAVKQFAERLKPHVAAAEDLGIVLGVENHSGSLISSADSQRRLLDLIPSDHLGIALAPYHLPQEETSIARLINNLGSRIVHFQAWQHGMGCVTKLPKQQELLQLPGRGPLDFIPILAALKQIHYAGRIEIFMHPVPRGIPILPTTKQVTAEINRARRYLQRCLVRV